MTIYKVIVNEYPSHKFTECWQQLKNIVPTLTESQRYAITLWWCGKLPKFLRSVVDNILHRTI